MVHRLTSTRNYVAAGEPLSHHEETSPPQTKEAQSAPPTPSTQPVLSIPFILIIQPTPVGQPQVELVS